jgi:ATP-binding cassette subfamily B protein
VSALPTWPIARAGEALVALAQAAGLEPRAAELGEAPATEGALDAWLDEAGGFLGVEVEGAHAAHEHIEQTLATCAPALLFLRTAEGPGLLAVAGARGRRLLALAPDLRQVPLPLADVARVAGAAVVDTVAPEVEALVTRAGISGAARARAADALVAARLRGRPIGGLHLLRRPPEAPARAHARDQRLGARVAGLLALHALAQMAWLASWWAIGKSVLGGAVSGGWLAAWAILLVSSQAARVLVGYGSGRLAIDGSVILAQRLLAGALRLDPDVLKREGIGGALGRVLESAAMQGLAVTGGVHAALAAVEIVLAGVVLAAGAGGAVHVLLLLAVVGLGALATRRYLDRRRAWTAQRLALTHALSEAMVGHATRLAQGDPAALEDRDDRALVRYLVASREVDRAQARLSVGIPLGWPVLAVLGLVPAFVLGAPGAAAVAAALGGVLFAADALARLAAGAARLADASIAWRSIAGLFAAAADRPDAAPPALSLAPPSPGAPVLAARGLAYRHAGRGAPVLAGCDLVVQRGERVLLDAPSGRGKSTLAAILAGLRRPEAGLVLAGGLDRGSVGARGWRRRVAYAPQFHDNHMFGGTLAFNLLMGRAWPPTPEDVAAADAVCRELGLGDLLDRMPSGLLEQVGETGWQLSHGERSRVFLARALLQQAELVVLDESLAALDPENLAVALRAIEARAPAAIVIAHP